MQFGIFIPIANNGWMMSHTSPQYMPTFALNHELAVVAEQYGFEFLLSMVKLRGFGGQTQFWDHALESFTLMSGLAAVTKSIKLYASVATLTIPPAMAARMAITVDDISGGRFGLNIVSGWNQSEYSQMGLWPGEVFYKERYDYASEYVRIMKELWSNGVSNFKGRYFNMEDCRLSPAPQSGSIPIICAGQSDRGMQFCAEYGDYQFIIGNDDIGKTAQQVNRMMSKARITGRSVGVYALYFIVTGETDEIAYQKWEYYRQGADLEAIAFMTGQAKLDLAGSTGAEIAQLKSAFSLNIGRIIGSHRTVANKINELGRIEGVKGVICIFDNYRSGPMDFGLQVKPLLEESSVGRASKNCGIANELVPTPLMSG